MSEVDNRYPRVWTHPVSAENPYPGFYAETLLPEGWWVQHYGETEELAEGNLRNYINSGRYMEDRNR